MKEYMYLFRGGEGTNAGLSPEQMQANMKKWMDWMQLLAQQGKMAGGEPLELSGKVVAGKAKKVTDGPFAEGKEVVGGYLVVKASDLDEATEISKSCPIFETDGTLEIREIRKVQM